LAALRCCVCSRFLWCAGRIQGNSIICQS